MTIAGILMTLLLFALIGFCVYLIVTYIPMAEPFKQMIVVASVVLCVLYLILVVAGQAPVVRIR